MFLKIGQLLAKCMTGRSVCSGVRFLVSLWNVTTSCGRRLSTDRLSRGGSGSRRKKRVRALWRQSEACSDDSLLDRRRQWVFGARWTGHWRLLGCHQGNYWSTEITVFEAAYLRYLKLRKAFFTLLLYDHHNNRTSVLCYFLSKCHIKGWLIAVSRLSLIVYKTVWIRYCGDDVKDCQSYFGTEVPSCLIKFVMMQLCWNPV